MSLLCSRTSCFAAWTADWTALLLAHVDADGVIALRHEDIAAELGTAREVVSRLLEAFERVGAVRRSRARIEIRDDALLRQLR